MSKTTEIFSVGCGNTYVCHGGADREGRVWFVTLDDWRVLAFDPKNKTVTALPWVRPSAGVATAHFAPWITPDGGIAWLEEPEAASSQYRVQVCHPDGSIATRVRAPEFCDEPVVDFDMVHDVLALTATDIESGIRKVYVYRLSTGAPLGTWDHSVSGLKPDGFYNSLIEDTTLLVYGAGCLHVVWWEAGVTMEPHVVPLELPALPMTCRGRLDRIDDSRGSDYRVMLTVAGDSRRHYRGVHSALTGAQLSDTFVLTRGGCALHAERSPLPVPGGFVGEFLGGSPYHHGFHFVENTSA